MFVAARWLLGAVVFVVAIILIRKSEYKHKRRLAIVACLGSVLFVFILGMLPIESAFTFSSPQSAFRLIAPPNAGKIRLILEGNETVLVISSKPGTLISKILLRTSKGWKIPTPTNRQKWLHEFVGSYSITVDNIKELSDYYITVVDTSKNAADNPLEITDSAGSSFSYFIDDNPNLRDYPQLQSVTYAAWIEGFDGNSTEEYYLLINGEKIVVPLN